MHVRYDNQSKTGADGGTISEQPMLFECMDICVLGLAHECEMRDFLKYLLIVKKQTKKHRFCLNSTSVH